MLIIKYDQYGEAINDFYALERVKDVIYKTNNFDDEIDLHICNECVLDLILGAIMHKVLPHDKVKLFCNDLEIRISEKGQLLDYMPFRMSELTYNALFGLDINMYKCQ